MQVTVDLEYVWAATMSAFVGLANGATLTDHVVIRLADGRTDYGRTIRIIDALAVGARYFPGRFRDPT